MRRNVKNGGGTRGRGEPNSHTWEVIKSLVSGEADASKLLEMYYWTREPGIVELIRAYLDLPERAQRHLGNYLLNNKPQSIATAIDQQGRLLLSSADEQGHIKNQHGSGT